MGDLSPTPFIWKDDSFVPATSYQLKRCKEHFKDGQRVFLVEHNERSTKWHQAYFAQLRDLHANLPDGMDADFPTPDHLRKFALIKCGFYDSVSRAFSSTQDARNAAALVRPIDEFSVVTVEGCVVTRYTAKSQDYRSMNKQEFTASARAVLNYVCDLVGVDPETGTREAGRAA